MTVEAFAHPTPGETSRWTRQWPRCILLLQLTTLCAHNRQSVSAGRLLKRVEAERLRMRGAPPLVETLLNELWYAANLLVHGERTAAARYADEACRKAKRIQALISELRRTEARHLARTLRLRSTFLQQRVQALLKRSNAALSRSRAAQERAAWALRT